MIKRSPLLVTNSPWSVLKNVDGVPNEAMIIDSVIGSQMCKLMQNKVKGVSMFLF